MAGRRSGITQRQHAVEADDLAPCDQGLLPDAPLASGEGGDEALSQFALDDSRVLREPRSAVQSIAQHGMRNEDSRTPVSEREPQRLVFGDRHARRPTTDRPKDVRPKHRLTARGHPSGENLRPCPTTHSPEWPAQATTMPGCVELDAIAGGPERLR